VIERNSEIKRGGKRKKGLEAVERERERERDKETKQRKRKTKLRRG
jgi:hypothetical protein